MGMVLTDKEIEILLNAISGNDSSIEKFNSVSNMRRIVIHDFLNPKNFTNQEIMAILLFTKEIASQFSANWGKQHKTELKYSIEGIENKSRESICNNSSYLTLRTKSFFCEAESQKKQKIFLAMNVSDIKKTSCKEKTEEQFKCICDEFIDSMQKITKEDVTILSIAESVQETSLNPLVFSYYAPDISAANQILSINPSELKNGFEDYFCTYEGEKDSCSIIKLRFESVKKKFSRTVFLIFPHDFAKSLCKKNNKQEDQNNKNPKKEITLPGFSDDVMVNLSVSLGGTWKRLDYISNIEEGSIIELESLIGDPVTVYSDEKTIAKAELIVIDGIFGIRIKEIL